MKMYTDRQTQKLNNESFECVLGLNRSVPYPLHNLLYDSMSKHINDCSNIHWTHVIKQN